MDGQFDECDLTFRELSMICESISKSVASIYHGRVKYTSSSDSDEEKTKDKEKPKPNGKEPEAPSKQGDSDEPPARSA